MWNKNGILIQGLEDRTNFVKNFWYLGINAYYQFPLTTFRDVESRKLTNEQQSKKISENQYMMTEFITEVDLFQRYLKKCLEMGIETRILFIESNYFEEIWTDELPKMKFIGYEYCPIPIDEQIITDMDWYKPFAKYWKELNEYGLFDTYEAVKRFADEYDKEFFAENVGDGEMDSYICKISQIYF